MTRFFIESIILLIIVIVWTSSALATDRECPKPLSLCEDKFNQPSGTVDGIEIPWDGNFPCAEYPYGQQPDGCSGVWDPEEVRDSWGPVSFVGACNSHDRCYYTWGSLASECNTQFLKDLEYACKRDLLGILDPRYESCLAIAVRYYAVVVSFQGIAHPEAQECQEKYEGYVESVVDNSGVVKDNKKEAMLMILNQYMMHGF